MTDNRTTGRQTSWSLARGPLSPRVAAFSLVEIMVVMALLTVIVLGLMSMFNQTQRAFRQGIMQTDVLEAGRMATDLLVREMEQTTPSYQPYMVNFYSEIPGYSPLVQQLPASTILRTNVLEDLYFLTRQNQTWTGVGYYVRTNGAYNYPLNIIGTLYRFETDRPAAQLTTGPDPFWVYWHSYNNPPYTNVSKIVDGVVQFRVRAYDTNGVLLNHDWEVNKYNVANAPNIGIQDSTLAPGEVGFYGFTNNAVPAYVEVELGVLEPAVLQRYNSIPDPTVASNYLATHAGNVHLFRQRIAVRNVDRTAYQ